MRKISKVLFVLGILSFIIIFALKMDNNNEMKKYYSDNEQKAKQELALLQDANSQLEENEEFFIIGDKEIDVMNQATEIVAAMNDFDQWCTTNFETHAPQCYYIFEEFLIDNGGIISQIEKVINN